MEIETLIAAALMTALWLAGYSLLKTRRSGRKSSFVRQAELCGTVAIFALSAYGFSLNPKDWELLFASIGL